MKLPVVICLLVLLFFSVFGCVEQQNYAQQPESISSQIFFDIDSNGQWDYAVYNFSGYQPAQSKIKITRQITVSTTNTATYTNFNNITDLGLMLLESELDGIIENGMLETDKCAVNIGTKHFKCVDASSCAKLCSKTSVECKEMVNEYETVIGTEIMNFDKDSESLWNNLDSAKKLVRKLYGGSEKDKNDFLSRIANGISNAAFLNANPIYNHPELTLCEHSNFELEKLSNISRYVGNYSTQTKNYHYTVVLHAEWNDSEKVGITITDKIPITDSTVSSAQQIALEKNGQENELVWASPKNSKMHILEYNFVSSEQPKDIVNKISTPEIIIKKTDLSILVPLNAVYTSFYGITKNFPLALGGSVAAIIIAIFIAYNLIMFSIGIGKAIISKKKPAASIKTVIGSIDVHWKVDAIIAVLLLGAGFYLSTFLSTGTASIIDITDIPDALVKDIYAAVGAAGVFLGLFLIFAAIENRFKVWLLERTYGNFIKEEKTVYLAKVAKLKDDVVKLEELINQYSTTGFDVTNEYETVVSLSENRIKNIAENMNNRNKIILENELDKVEETMKRLEEKKKTAEEKWSEWNTMISKFMEEKDEISIYSLGEIPASLRTWALTRYAKEHEDEGIVVDHDSIRKKKVEAGQVAIDLVKKDILQGLIVVKNEQVIVSKMQSGSNTVNTVLFLKMRNYLKSLAKNLGQTEIVSVASVGTKNVIIMLNETTTEALLIMEREKFKEGITAWREKEKLIAEDEKTA